MELESVWRIFLEGGLEEMHAQAISSHEHTGRPLSDVVFIEQLERTLNRHLRKNRPGPKKMLLNIYILCPQNSPRGSTRRLPENMSNIILSRQIYQLINGYATKVERTIKWQMI